jgi:hypothetical protein
MELGCAANSLRSLSPFGERAGVRGTSSLNEDRTPLTPTLSQSKSDISDFDHFICRSRVNPTSAGRGSPPPPWQSYRQIQTPICYRMNPSSSPSAQASVRSIGSPCMWRTVILVISPCVKICAAILGGDGEAAIDKT